MLYEAPFTLLNSFQFLPGPFNTTKEPRRSSCCWPRTKNFRRFRAERQRRRRNPAAPRPSTARSTNSTTSSTARQLRRPRAVGLPASKWPRRRRPPTCPTVWSKPTSTRCPACITSTTATTGWRSRPSTPARLTKSFRRRATSRRTGSGFRPNLW